MNRERFIKGMLYYAAVQPRYAPEFTKQPVVEFWYENLKCLSESRLATVMNDLIVSRETFPSLSEIRERGGLDPDPLSHDEKSRIAIARIREAISKYGAWNPKDAEMYIGPLGWRVVTHMGTWDSICATQSTKELDFLLTQARELSKALLHSSDVDLSMLPLLGGSTEDEQKRLENEPRIKSNK
jgi:hypothetical protein